MKITKTVLLLFVFLCTSNVWAQLNENGHQDFVSENRVIKDMQIRVCGLDWNGMLIIKMDGKPLCLDFGEGILLLAGQNYIERTAQIDVYPGGELTIWSSRVGIGNTNVVSLTIPEDIIDPILVVENTYSSHSPLRAYFSRY